MAVLPNMGLITPTLGGDSGVWDDKINACFAIIDAHDHAPGAGAQVPTAGININADLQMNGYNLIEIGMLKFDAVAAPAAGVGLYRKTSDNELYWRTASNTHVKLTDGSQLNVSIVGGIGGDYAAVGAQVAFDDADQVYTFKDQSSPSRKWARIASGPIRIYENDTTESVYVELAAPAALGSSYTATWPTALPASTKALYMSASGVISTSATHQLVIPASAMQNRQNWGTIDGTYMRSSGGGQGILRCAVPLPVGATVTGYTVYLNKTSNAGISITSQLIGTDGTTGTDLFTTPGTGTETSSADNPGFITLSKSGESLPVDAVTSYMLSIYNGAASTGEYIHHVTVDYTL